MSNVVRQHPLTGVFVASTLISKYLTYDHWFSHQFSNIQLAKNKVESGNTPFEEMTRLKKYIKINELKLTCVFRLAKVPIFPIFMAFTWFSLEDRLITNLNQQRNLKY